jgi:hypothetical protein
MGKIVFVGEIADRVGKLTPAWKMGASKTFSGVLSGLHAKHLIQSELNKSLANTPQLRRLALTTVGRLAASLDSSRLVCTP